jgi:cytochrome oxidase Cu insertion factor (SCO1/SenC/PrrC family)
MSAGDRARSLISLWLIAAVTLTPVAASYLFYYLRPPQRSAAYGELLPAAPLPEARLALADGSPFELSRLRGKWVLVTVDAAPCDAYCEKKLVYLRQLRLTQGRNMNRVERVWLIVSGTPRPETAARFRGTWFVRASAELLRHFPAPAAPADHIYVIDPLGNLMMRYPREPDPSGMVRDLTRLLRLSRIG